MMYNKIVLVDIFFFIYFVNGSVELNCKVRNPVFNPKVYEEVLDPELCHQQLDYIKSRNNTRLMLEFLEAGMRIPRSILMGNSLDMGNYMQCLGISKVVQDTTIEGKYCTVNVPISGTYDGSPEDFDAFDPNRLVMNNDTLKQVLEYNEISKDMLTIVNGNEDSKSSRILGSFNLAVCIPKPCTIKEGIDGLYFNVTKIGFQFDEGTCRFKGDKPWAPVEYVGIAFFSLLGILTLLSTCYDFRQTVVLGKDPKSVSTLYRSFSVYTNGRRLTTFVSSSDNLECVDGIRSLAMMWVIFGHTYTSLPPTINNLHVFEFLVSYRSFYLTTAPLTVDTFFMLSGMLLVYTTAGKLNSMKLLQNLHVFYLNRLLRMFPLLAAIVLMQSAFFHRISDGPLWDEVARQTDVCRTYWWSTFLYIQNYVRPTCQGHTWYLAIDMQLYILSPIFLFWVLGKSKINAWISLTAGLLISLVSATIYNFINEFSAVAGAPGRPAEDGYAYMTRYYINTLTRASPFFVGMIFGYLLHVWRGKNLVISQGKAILLWLCGLIITLGAMLSSEPAQRPEFNNQIYESFLNSFMRPIWALGLGWIVFACHKGYGGPVNWFLSLQMWKLPSRISYSMYLFHWSIMSIVRGRALAPILFTPEYAFYVFLSHLTLSYVVGFIMTIVIDSPFSTIFKLILGGDGKKPVQKSVPEKMENKR